MASSACFPLWKVFFECLRLCEEKELPDASRHARHLITELTWRDFFRFYAGKHGAPHGRYMFWILQHSWKVKKMYLIFWEEVRCFRHLAVPIFIYLNISSISSLFIPWSVFRRDVPHIPGDHIDVMDHVNNSVHIKHQTNTKYRWSSVAQPKYMVLWSLKEYKRTYASTLARLSFSFDREKGMNKNI